MHDREIQLIIRALRRIQTERHLSLKGLAYQLGFSVGHLSMIFTGKRRPGLRFVQAAIERFEEIRRLVAEGLAPSDSEKKGR